MQVASPDGMKVGTKGNLYVASGVGVAVFSGEGERIGTIGFPEVPANCCFGDADHKTLFVTARTSLYRVRLNDSEVGVDSKRNLTLTWSSLPGRTYTVYRSSDMVTWEPVADDIASTDDAATRWTDVTRPLLSPEVRRGYYKISESQ